MFIELTINVELHAMNLLELKFFVLSSEFSEFFNNIPDRILLDVLFCVFRFSKASSNALIFSFTLICCRVSTDTYARLPCQLCNFICKIIN